MKTPPILAVAFASLLLAAQPLPVIGADVWPLSFSTTEIRSAQLGLTITISADASTHRLKSVVLQWQKVEMRVPVEELNGISDVRLDDLRVVSTARRLPALPEALADDKIVVILQYGDIVSIDPDARQRVRSKVYLVFGSKGYYYRDRLVPVQYSNQWKYYYKGRGTAEEEQEEIGEPRGDPNSPPSEPVRN
jgi:hypothetical protein